LGATAALLVALCAAAQASPPKTERQLLYSHQLRGEVVGFVELYEGARIYRYRSVHLFPPGVDRPRRERAVSFALNGGADDAGGQRWEARWLSRRPTEIGCVQVKPELGGSPGPACVTQTTRAEVIGTVRGMPFQARYDPAGGLARLELGEATFTRVALPPDRSPRDLFGEGLPVEGEAGALGLRPRWRLERIGAEPARWEEKAARALAAQLREQAAAVTASEEGPSCLTQARAFVAQSRARGGDAWLVHGLALDGGGRRARPHAWVRVRAGDKTVDLDPTWGGEVRPPSHLPLLLVGEGADPAAPGRAWLQVLFGAYRVEREAPEAQPSNGAAPP
jgi:hypothetical protein